MKRDGEIEKRKMKRFVFVSITNNVISSDQERQLSRIDTTLDTLVGCTIFSTLDLKSSYWKIGLEPRDKEYTEFTAAMLEL